MPVMERHKNDKGPETLPVFKPLLNLRCADP